MRLLTSVASLILVSITVAGLLTLTGCQSLETKGVVVKTDVYGLRLTAGADPTSGAITPGIMAGGMNMVVFTLPQGEGATLEYEEEGFSFWGWVFGSGSDSKWRVKITTGEKLKIESDGDASFTVTSSDKVITVNALK